MLLDNLSALDAAVLSGNKAVLEKLLDYGADINNTDSLGQKAFHYASRRNELETFKFLINHPKVKINARDNTLLKTYQPELLRRSKIAIMLSVATLAMLYGMFYLCPIADVAILTIFLVPAACFAGVVALIGVAALCFYALKSSEFDQIISDLNKRVEAALIPDQVMPPDPTPAALLSSEPNTEMKKGAVAEVKLSEKHLLGSDNKSIVPVGSGIVNPDIPKQKP